MTRSKMKISGTIIYLLLFAFVLSAVADDSFTQADRDRLTRVERGNSDNFCAADR